MNISDQDSKCIGFVKSVLNPNEPFPKLDSEEEWKGLYRFCQKQTIVGTVFDGLQRYYEEEDELIPSGLTLEWYAQAEQIRRRNLLMNKRCGETTRFFLDAGFRSCILKGQGNAQMYPNPLSRMSGDIDVWVEGTRKEIKHVVQEKAGETFEISHHIALPLFEDVEVEVHFIPGEMCNPFYNRRLQNYYLNSRSEQMSNGVSLEHSENRVSTPTKQFNAIFQISHIMCHFFIEGVGLRHFIDYFFLLRQGFSDEERMSFEYQIKELGMTDFAQSVMWIEKYVLGLEDVFLLLPPYEQGGQLLLEELLATGNMGHHDARYSLRKRGLFARGIADAYRDLQLARVFPSEGFWKPFQKILNQRWKIKQLLKL